MIPKLYDLGELVDRFHSKFTSLTGSKDAGKARTYIKDPDIQIQNKKMHIVNFTQVCHSIKRDPNELSSFMAQELQKQTSITANGILLIHHIYKRNDIIDVIKKYVIKFVRCPSCGSDDTSMTKLNRINYIKCDRCQSSNAIL